MVKFAGLMRVAREHPVRIVLAFFCILAFVSLNLVNAFAPLAIHDRNEKEIMRIKAPDPESFTFAVLGDNRGNNDIFEPLLRSVNRHSGAAFVIDVGDLVENGRRAQYRRLLNQLAGDCAIPFLAAIGNHDLTRSRGPGYFEEIFGPTYYTFQVGRSYFIVLDAAKGSGFDKAELQWLRGELQKSQSSKTRFVFMHVPPFDPRGNGFSKSLGEKDRKDLLDLFKQYNVTHLFAGHIHGYFSGLWEGIPYTITGGGGGGLQGSDPEHFFYHYVKVQVTHGLVEVVAKPVDRDATPAYILNRIKDNKVELAVFFGAGILIITSVFSTVRRHPG